MVGQTKNEGLKDPKPTVNVLTSDVSLPQHAALYPGLPRGLGTRLLNM